MQASDADLFVFLQNVVSRGITRCGLAVEVPSILRLALRNIHSGFRDEQTFANLNHELTSSLPNLHGCYIFPFRNPIPPPNVMEDIVTHDYEPSFPDELQQHVDEVLFGRHPSRAPSPSARRIVEAQPQAKRDIKSLAADTMASLLLFQGQIEDATGGISQLDHVKHYTLDHKHVSPALKVAIQDTELVVGSVSLQPDSAIGYLSPYLPHLRPSLARTAESNLDTAFTVEESEMLRT